MSQKQPDMTGFYHTRPSKWFLAQKVLMVLLKWSAGSGGRVGSGSAVAEAARHPSLRPAGACVR